MIDAKSAALAVEDIIADTLGNLDEKEDRPGKALEAQERMYPGKFRGLSAAFRMIGMLFGELVSTLIGRRPARLPMKDLEMQSDRDLRILHFEFDRTQSSALIEKCRAEAKTIQGAFLAAQLMAIRQEIERGGFVTLGILSAVNLRPYLISKIEDREAGMCISMIPSDHRVSEKSDFWSLARQTRKQLGSRIDRGYGHVFWSAFPPMSLFWPDKKGAGRLLKLTLSAPQRTIVTNIGRLGERRPAISHAVRLIHLSMGPPIGSPLVTAASSFDGKLTLNCCVNLAELEEARAERIVTTIRQKLMEQCEGVSSV